MTAAPCGHREPRPTGLVISAWLIATGLVVDNVLPVLLNDTTWGYQLNRDDGYGLILVLFGFLALFGDALDAGHHVPLDGLPRAGKVGAGMIAAGLVVAFFGPADPGVYMALTPILCGFGSLLTLVRPRAIRTGGTP